MLRIEKGSLTYASGGATFQDLNFNDFSLKHPDPPGQRLELGRIQNGAAVQIGEDQLTISLSPFLASKNPPHQILARVLTAIQQPGAEIKRPVKMVVEMWE